MVIPPSIAKAQALSHGHTGVSHVPFSSVSEASNEVGDVAALMPNDPRLEKQLSGAIVTLYALQAINYIFPFLTFPYLTHTLGLSEFGQVQITLAYAAIGGIFTDWGFNFSATHAAARTRFDRTGLSHVAMNTIGAKLSLFVIWLPLGSLFGALFVRSHVDSVGYAFSLLVVFSTTITPNWLYQGIERFKEMSICMAVTRVFTTIAVFAFVRSPADGYAVVALTGLNGIIVSTWLWGRVIFRRDIIFFAPQISSMLQTLTDGAEIFVTQLVTTSYTAGAVLVVGALGGAHAAGAYAIVDRLISACKAILLPVTQVVYARVSAFHHITHSKFLNVTQGPFLILFALVLCAMTLLIVGKKFIFEKILGVALSDISGILPFLAATLPVLVLAHWMVTAGLLARGLRRRWMAVIFSGPITGLIIPVAFFRHLPPATFVAVGVLSIECMIVIVGYLIWRKSWQSGVY